MDWGSANSRFLGLVSVGAARSLYQMALRPSVIKRIRQIDVKCITHIASHHVVDVRKDILSKNAAPILFIMCYKGEVQPYRKTDYKPIIYHLHRCYIKKMYA